MFLEFNLGTLIRIDLRADEHGKLHILEANPKPDLKYPTAGVTSLVSAGLSQTGLGYDDLLLSLLGDRLDFLLRNYRDTVRHITDLLDDGTMERLDSERHSRTVEDNTNLAVRALEETAQRMRIGNRK